MRKCLLNPNKEKNAQFSNGLKYFQDSVWISRQTEFYMFPVVKICDFCGAL